MTKLLALDLGDQAGELDVVTGEERDLLLEMAMHGALHRSRAGEHAGAPQQRRHATQHPAADTPDAQGSARPG
jgi:hypothetical protein